MASPQIKPAVHHFQARRGLRGPHAQTLVSFFFSRRLLLPVPEERLIEVEPGVCVRCLCHWQASRKDALTVIIVHGLEGSSDSGYMHGLAHKGLALGMNIVRMNQRNCGGMDASSPTLYHSGRSDDLAAVVRRLIVQDEISRVALVGYSMGGNLVLKLAGEWGNQAPPELRAIAAVCPSVDLSASVDALHSPSLLNRIYERYFLWKICRRLRTKAKHFPGVFDVTRLRGVTTLRDFDEKITAHYCGFAGAEDYYNRSAAANVVEQIALPTLIVHASKDPFICIVPETRRKLQANPHITFIETEHGGHCSFLAARNGDDGHWEEKQILEFLGPLRG